MSNKKLNVKKIVKLVGKFISIISIAFVVYAIYKLGFDFSQVKNWPLFILVVCLCSIAKGITVFMSGTAWYRWLCFFSGKKADRREALRVYSKANIGKYLPGNVMHYVERNLFAGKLGISQKKLAISSLMEVVTLATSATVLAIVLSAKSLVTAIKAIIDLIGLTYVVVAFAVGIVMFIAIVFIFRRKIFSILADYSLATFVKTLVGNVALYALVQFILGSLMVILYLYMGFSFDLQKAGIIVSGYVIAWVMGFIVPGAPGGMGVREMVITLLLGSVIGKSMIVTLSVIHRLITIIGDFEAYWFGMFFLADKSKKIDEVSDEQE
ncbi:MAG: hypothetical protein IKN54_04785 [Lachnospiraceae bacterium]|nr:hypothetical protein [Lachnospiraceae bacterium]